MTAIPAQASVATVNLSKNDTYKTSSTISSKTAHMKGNNSSQSSHYVMFQAQYKTDGSFCNDVCKNIKPGNALKSTQAFTFQSNVTWRLYLNPTLYYTNCTASGSISDTSSYK